MASISNYIGSITRASVGGSISDPSYGSITGQYNLASLFTNGAQGFLNDTLPAFSIFTTAAGSTNASAAGDSVGREESLITPQNNATQGTAGARPTRGAIPQGGIINQLARLGAPSEDFDNATWVEADLTATDGAVAGPYAGSTAASLIPTTANSFHRISVTGASYAAGSSTYTWWAVVKAAGYNIVALRESAATGASAVFDLDAGTPFAAYSAGGVTVSNAAMTDLGDGWWLVEADFAGAVTSSIGIYVLETYAAGDPQTATYAGDGISGIYLCRAQIQFASAAMTYQAVTAAYDVAQEGTPSITWLYADGGDSLTLGIASFGAATSGLSPQVGNSWNVCICHSTFSSGTLLGQTEQAADANQMFNYRIASNGEAQVVLSGTSNVISAGVATGLPKVVSINCANGVVTARVNSGARSAALTVGAAGDEAVNILFFGRNATTPANQFTGFGIHATIIDRSLSDTEEAQEHAQLVSYLGAA